MSTNSEEVEPYRWMFKWKWSNGTEILEDHHAWLFEDVRENYEDQLETSAAFKVRDMVSDGDSGTGVQGDRATVTGMLSYLGAWRCPPRFTQAKTNNWINHQAKWAPKYSDGSVVCPCGAVKYYTENHMHGEGYDQECTDDCTKINEHRTKMLIWQNRDRILRQAALNHLPQQRVAERIDLTAESVSHHCRLLNIDYEGLQWHGYRKWRKTMHILQEKFGFSQRDLSNVFGKSRSTLREHINGNLRPYQQEETSIQHGVIAHD